MARGRPKKVSQDVLLRSAEFIGWALGGLEREIAQTRERLSALNAEAAKLRARLGTRARAGRTAGGQGQNEAPGAGGAGRKRRRMSPEARKRISEMMKKRWAERRKKA